ncbi:MAG: HD domain-containing protein [Elioraea sp.]|nr:HD domain-containing protein [Elioraea sp.]
MEEGRGAETAGTGRLGDLVSRAEAFARDLHAGHLRQGRSSRPYVTHLEEVAALLHEAGAEEAVLAAGWLHDAVDNALTANRRVTARELSELFGWEVAAMVAELADNPRIPLPLRKDIRLRSARYATAGARMVTLADLTSQLRALIEDAPADWDHGRKVEYFGWAARVAANCRGHAPSLEAAFTAAYRAGLARLAAEA